VLDCDALVNIHQEEEEESFVMTSLLAAAEEGNVDAIKELMESSSHFDVSLANRVRHMLVKVTWCVELRWQG